MIPVEGDTLGRSGLLAHGYMLGPNGDSNGCVSIRDYERFLAAFERGEIKRLVVVSNVADLARQPLKPICLMTGAPIRANLAKACEPAIAQKAGQ